MVVRIHHIADIPAQYGPGAVHHLAVTSIPSSYGRPDPFR